jgi:hypothetical protein
MPVKAKAGGQGRIRGVRVGGQIGSGSNPSSPTGDPPGYMLDHFAADGPTYPFYGDATTPCGVYESSTNKTWVSWEGWTGSARVVRVAVYTHSSGLWSSTFTAGTNTLVDDDHGAPSICRDVNGYWHIFYGAHNSSLKHAITSSPDDPSTWTDQGTLVADNVTYPHPTMVGSVLYLFARYVLASTDWCLALYKSSSIVNGVITLIPGTTLIADFGNDSRFYQGPHILRGGKIHIVATRANNADTIRQDVYYLVYDPSTGGVANLDGSVTTSSGSLPVNRTTLDASYRILVQPTVTAHANIPHVCYDAAGDLHLLYIDEPTTGDLGVFHRIYSGGSWNTAIRIGTIPAKDTAFLIVPNGTGVEAYWSAKQGKRFVNGGDLMRNIRPSGGPWGTATILKAATAYPLGEPTAVLNGVANAKVIFSEINDSTATEAGTLRGWLYGDSGYVQKLWPAPFAHPTTWGVSDFRDSVTYSADLLTTASASTFIIQRCTNAIGSSDKKYFELVLPVVSVAADTGVGVATGNQDMSQFLGQSNEGIAMYGSGMVYRNNVLLTTYGTFAATSNVSIAVDRPNNKIWWRVNGGNWNNDVIGNQNPATNTGGQDISAVAGNLFPAFHVEHAGDSCTGKFASGSWTYAAPSGFTEIIGVP